MHPHRQQLVLVVITVDFAALLNYAVVRDTAFLYFYNIIVVGAAYLLGRRLATLSAVLSLLLVVFFALIQPGFLNSDIQRIVTSLAAIAAWGAFLILTAVLTGSLFDRREKAIRELRETYH